MTRLVWLTLIAARAAVLVAALSGAPALAQNYDTREQCIAAAVRGEIVDTSICESLPSSGGTVGDAVRSEPIREQDPEEEVYESGSWALGFLDWSMGFSGGEGTCLSCWAVERFTLAVFEMGFFLFGYLAALAWFFISIAVGAVLAWKVVKMLALAGSNAASAFMDIMALTIRFSVFSLLLTSGGAAFLYSWTSQYPLAVGLQMTADISGSVLQATGQGTGGFGTAAQVLNCDAPTSDADRNLIASMTARQAWLQGADVAAFNSDTLLVVSSTRQAACVIERSFVGGIASAISVVEAASVAAPGSDSSWTGRIVSGLASALFKVAIFMFMVALFGLGLVWSGGLLLDVVVKFLVVGATMPIALFGWVLGGSLGSWIKNVISAAIQSLGRSLAIGAMAALCFALIFMTPDVYNATYKNFTPDPERNGMFPITPGNLTVKETGIYRIDAFREFLKRASNNNVESGPVIPMTPNAPWLWHLIASALLAYAVGKKMVASFDHIFAGITEQGATLANALQIGAAKGVTAGAVVGGLVGSRMMSAYRSKWGQAAVGGIETGVNAVGQAARGAMFPNTKNNLAGVDPSALLGPRPPGPGPSA